VLDTPQIVLTVEGAANLAKGVTGAIKPAETAPVEPPGAVETKPAAPAPKPPEAASIGPDEPPAPTAQAGPTSSSPQNPVAQPAAGPSANVKPDVPTQEIIPIDKIGTRKGEAFAPKVNKAPGAYRGITPKMRSEAQRVGERYQGPGKYDVGHRTPLSQVPPGERVRLKSEEFTKNRADADSIAKANELRKKVGLYTR
jgi:hypothetical protein